MAIAILTTWPVLGQTTERVSVTSSEAQAIGGRYTPRPAVSNDGSTVVFESALGSLVPGDTNFASDIFVSAGGTLTRVTGPGGVQPTCASQRAAVSSNGRFVAFDSCASNLVAGDNNSASDVFLLDRDSSTITRVSVTSTEFEASGSSYAAAISPNGQFVAFLSSASNLDAGASGTHVYLRDVVAGNTYLVSRAPSGTALPTDVRPSVADNGTVAFVTPTNVAGLSDNNNVADVFLRTGVIGGTPATVRVSLSASGGQLSAASTRPTISADGQLVAFETSAAATTADTNGLTDIYIRDVAGNTTVLVSKTPGGAAGNGNSIEASINGAGTYVSFTSQASNIAGPFDAYYDVFRAAVTRTGAVTVTDVTRISLGTGTQTGESGASDVADAGRVVYSSDEPLLVAGDVNGDTDVFAFDGVTTRLTLTGGGLSPGYSGASQRPAPSYDGSIVAFLASATNLVEGDINARVDVFVRNRLTGLTERLPIPAGAENVDADWVTISHDGRFIAFSRGGAYLYDRFNGTTVAASALTPGGTVVTGQQARVSASGRYVVFTATAAIDPADTNFAADVYRFDRLTSTTVLVSRGATIGNSSSSGPTISGNGELVAFVSSASNLVPGDTNLRSDVFVRNIPAGTTVRLSTNLDAQPSNIDARDAFISTDGSWVAYLLSSNVLTSEATAASDVYLARSDGSLLRGPVSGPTENVGTTQGSYDPTLSMFGRFLSYRSYVPDIVGGDGNNAADVFGRQVLGAPGVTTFQPALRLTVSQGGGDAVGGTGLDSENPEMIGNGRGAVFQSGFDNLVADDTNRMVDAFVRGGIFGNGECDYIDATLPGYTAWAAQFGLDPCTNGGSPYADPDGDGATNEEEQNGGGDGNPTLGIFTRYFAEGATKTASLNFDTRIALANPANATVTGEISYQLPSGAAVLPTPFTLQPYERKTVQLDEQDGIGENGPAGAYEFSTTVKANAPIGVDRTMTWDKTTYSGHAETGVVSPARKWYFAEGATIGGFNLFYLLQNPSTSETTVEARYLLGTGQVFTKSYVLPPNSRTNVWANVETFNGARALASAEFSAEFTVVSGDNIIAERAMYRGANPMFKAGHESAGITEPALEWFLAEGNAGTFFDHFVLIGNTTASAALVQADFIVGNSGVIYTKQYSVGPNSRFNIWVDQEEVAPGNRPFQTGNTDVSVRIRSLNNVPLIVERAMWWPGSSNTWYEAHNSPGSSRTAGKWVLAEGENGGSIGWSTYVLVANTGATAGTISVRLLLPNGITGLVPGLPVAANSRTTYFLGDLLTAAGLPTDTQAGVLIESEGTTLPLVVERAMYRNVNGITFQVGTNALGTPLP